MAKHGPETRQQILRAALKRFANAGYAATSVQQIVGDARVSKPALYYHFRDKAGLFQALVNEALDQRLQVVQQAAARPGNIRGQLVEILAALFEYFHKNRDLTRLAFSAAFAALVSDLPAGTNSMVNESPRNWAPILATFDFDSIMRQKRVHPAAMPYKTRLGVRAVRILFE